MKTKAEVETQLRAARVELERISKSVPAGTGAWRTTQGYIDALEWVLELEELNES